MTTRDTWSTTTATHQQKGQRCGRDRGPPPPEGFPEADDFAPALVGMIDVADQVFVEELSVWGTRQVLSPF